MARRSALGGNYQTKNLEAALKRLEVDFDKLEKTSKTAKKSKYKAKRRGTGTATVSHTNRGGLSYNDIFKWGNSGVAQLDRMFKVFVDDLANDLKGKGRTWAIETRAMMREVSPVLTGNLRDSVKILSADNVDAATIGEKLEMADKNRSVAYIVGISEKAILPPPFRKHVIRKNSPEYGKMHTMPKYNYAIKADTRIRELKSEGYQGFDFLEKWQEIAKRNAERIFK